MCVHVSTKSTHYPALLYILKLEAFTPVSPKQIFFLPHKHYLSMYLTKELVNESGRRHAVELSECIALLGYSRGIE